MDDIKEIAAFFGLWLGSVIVLVSVIIGIIYLFYMSVIAGWVAVGLLLLLCVWASFWGLSE